MIGRLRPDVTPQAAGYAWTRANAAMQAKSTGPKYDIAATTFLDYSIGPARQAMWVLLGAVGVLLLIACANVSGLMLTRVSLRSHDDAIRTAIGGSRAAIARLWAMEAVWLTRRFRDGGRSRRSRRGSWSRSSTGCSAARRRHW